MKKILPILILTAFSIIFAPNGVWAFNYVMGTTTFSKPTQERPAKSESFIDPLFHTTTTRITDKILDGLPPTNIEVQ